MSDDRDRDRAPDRDREEAVGGLLGAIRGILEAVSDAEHEGRPDFGGTRRYSKGHFTTEYGFSGSIGGARSRGDSGTDADTGSGSRSGSDASSEEDESYRIDVRRDEDELLVVADLPAVDAEDLTLGVDEARDELVIGVDDRAVERVELPWTVADVDARFHHGILELRSTPDSGGETA